MKVVYLFGYVVPKSTIIASDKIWRQLSLFGRLGQAKLFSKYCTYIIMYKRCATILNLIKYWSTFQSSYFLSQAHFHMKIIGRIEIQNINPIAIDHIAICCDRKEYCSVYNSKKKRIILVAPTR